MPRLISIMLGIRIGVTREGCGLDAGVSGGTLVDLKAQLYRTQEESKLRKEAGDEGGYQQARKRLRGEDPDASNKNSGVEERDMKDKLSLKVVKMDGGRWLFEHWLCHRRVRVMVFVQMDVLCCRLNRTMQMNAMQPWKERQNCTTKFVSLYVVYD